MKFFSPEVALYLYKPAICPCMEYCCHVWAGASSCYLKLLYDLQKWICRTVAPSLAAFLELLAHHQNLASLSLSYRYYFGRCSSELAQLVSGTLFLRDVYITWFFCHHSWILHGCLSTVPFLGQLNFRILCL